MFCAAAGAGLLVVHPRWHYLPEEIGLCVLEEKRKSLVMERKPHEKQAQRGVATTREGFPSFCI